MEPSSQVLIYRPISQRAGRACEICRRKKIKCDVSMTGSPCTNCDIHSRCCSVEKSRRGRKPRAFYSKHHLTSTESSQRPAEGYSGRLSVVLASSVDAAKSCHKAQRLNIRDEDSIQAIQVRDVLSSRVYENIHLPSEEAPRRQALDHIDYSILHQEPSYARLISRPCVELLATPDDDTTTPGFAEEERFSTTCPVPKDHILPNFIQDISSSVSSQDMQYLREKGALEIPDTQLRDALVRCFVEYVYPTMPVIDLYEFLRALDSSSVTSKPKISILVFQAVMFSAVAFVDLDFLKRAGYKSRRGARRIFYKRAQLLHDVEVEHQPLCVIAAVLLLTHCTESPGDLRGGWYWLGIAISLAFALGLNRNRPERRRSDQSWWQARRIWWTCYVRDRTQAQYLSCPMRIRNAEFDTPRLTLEDFDLDGLEELELLGLCGLQVPCGCHTALQKSIQNDQATIFIMMTELCVYIGETTAIHFSVLARGKIPATCADTEQEGAKISRTPQSNPTGNKTAGLHWRLMQWFSNLPSSCVYQPPHGAGLARQESFVFVHRALLHLAFHNTISTLHRSRALPPGQHGNFGGDTVGKDSWDYTYQASRDVSRICCDLRMANFDRFLPTTVATMQLSPIITQLSHLHTGPMNIRSRALKDIFHCYKLLEILQELYPSADFCAEFVADMLRRQRIDVLTDGDSGMYGLVFRGIHYNFKDIRGEQIIDSPIVAPKMFYQPRPNSTTTVDPHDMMISENESTSSVEPQRFRESAIDSSSLHSSPNNQSSVESETAQTPSAENWVEMLFNFNEFQDGPVSAF